METSKKISLKRQFVTKMLVVMFLIVLVFGSIQFYFMKLQVEKNVKTQSYQIGNSIEQGIAETDSATLAIEKQLDLKLKVISQRISDRLAGKSVNDVSNEELKSLSKEMGLAGITLLASQGDDVVGTKSTDKDEIGFSFKKMFGPEDSGFLGMKDLLSDKTPVQTDVSYVDHNTIVLYTSESGSHTGRPQFFKYAYYHAKGQDFVIAPYIEANEVYKFTQEVGPNSWISKVLKTNEYAKEVAVLDPRVYADPSLAKKIYPPLEKVVYGAFKLSNKKDESTLLGMTKHSKQVSYISTEKGKKYYKMFTPMKDGKVIYVALDYQLISAPLKSLSFILIVFSLLSLISLFVLSTRFFSSIYKSIQVIMNQIKKLEWGDFTSRSEVKENGELAELSSSINHMTSTLSHVIKDTTKQAEKVKSLSLSLQSDANESVENMYILSVDLTSKARDVNFEVMDFLDAIEVKLESFPESESKQFLTRIQAIREMSNKRTESTTDITITLSDLLSSLQSKSVELSDISSTLFKNMYKFKL